MHVEGINAGLIQALHAEYLESPDHLPAAWRQFFGRELLAVAP